MKHTRQDRGRLTAFKHRQLDNPQEEVVCSVCDKTGEVENFYTTCFGGLICDWCERSFNRRHSYAKPKKSNTEKAHDKQFGDYLKGKAHTEIKAQFIFQGNKDDEAPTTIKGPLNEKLATAFQEE